MPVQCSIFAGAGGKVESRRVESRRRILEVEVQFEVAENRSVEVVGKRMVGMKARRSISAKARAGYKWVVACMLPRELCHESSWVLHDMNLALQLEAAAVQAAELAHLDVPEGAHVLLFAVERGLMASVALSDSPHGDVMPAAVQRTVARTKCAHCNYMVPIWPLAFSVVWMSFFVEAASRDSVVCSEAACRSSAAFAYWQRLLPVIVSLFWTRAMSAHCPRSPRYGSSNPSR